MTVHEQLLQTRQKKGAVYLILIDPDKADWKTLPDFVTAATDAGVDGFLVGGSISLSLNLEQCIKIVKQYSPWPAIIFPGGIHQICASADAILFLSLISGRNAEQLIGQHVLAAPIIKQMGLEAISTGYMLIESGRTTTVAFVSNTRPIPRDKTEIAIAHALAAEYLGMKTVYLEAGSGAEHPVPDEMVQGVARYTSIPVVVGGGIRTPEIARRKVEAGASIIVTGTILENERNHQLIKEFADAIHVKQSKGIEI